MNPRIVRAALVSIALLPLLFAGTARSQLPEEKAREAIVERIREHAVREVQTSTPMDRDLVLRRIACCFGEALMVALKRQVLTTMLDHWNAAREHFGGHGFQLGSGPLSVSVSGLRYQGHSLTE